MPIYSSPALARRKLLLAGAALGVAGALPLPLRPAQGAPTTQRLTAGLTRVALAGGQYPATAVMAYDGTVPGPTLRARQGEPFALNVENRLGETTTVHCHGIRLPNAMDGVPGLTQPPIRSGGSFTYAFTPPDAGTFWYHPHDNSLVQIGRGLAGALIVEEAEPPRADRELLWVIQDWRLTDELAIVGSFGNPMEAAMAGRIGNAVTINGQVPAPISVRAGERIRLRIVNAAVARIMALGFAGHRPTVIALNGQPCEPHEPPGGRILLGPAMRAELMLDMSGEPGSRYAVSDDFYGDRFGYRLTELVYEATPPLRPHPLDAPLRLPPNPLPPPDLAAAERHDIVLQGGMMGGMGMMGMGGMGMRGAAWAINGRSMTGDGSADMPPLLTLRRGVSCVLALRNETAWWHPIHLHGYAFRALSRNGTAGVWGDTVLIPPRETAEIAFVADNQGKWMLHCHIIDHQVAGMMAVLRVA